jgi:hypothetical protein
MCKLCDGYLYFFKLTKAFMRTFRKLKMAVFWVVAPGSLVEVYRHFRGTCCLHHQGPAVGSNPRGGGESEILARSRVKVTTKGG